MVIFEGFSIYPWELSRKMDLSIQLYPFGATQQFDIGWDISPDIDTRDSHHTILDSTTFQLQKPKKLMPEEYYQTTSMIVILLN